MSLSSRSTRPFVALLVPLRVAAAAAACGGSSSHAGAGFGVVQSSLSRDTSPQVPTADEGTLATDNTKFRRSRQLCESAREGSRTLMPCGGGT